MRAAWLALALLPACAWDAGEPFGEVSGALTARWTVPAGRDLGGGWQKLASDFEVRVDGVTWTTTSLDLIPGAAAALDFDPANPPPGYSLCHNGHCHADDGRLVPYEDIAAEASGGKPPQPVARFPIGELDLTAGAALPLTCDGPCALPRGTIARVELGVGAIEASGLVRDGRQPPRLPGERAWTSMLAPAVAVPVVGRTDLPVDRGSSPTIALDVALAPSAALLDGVRWEVLAASAGDLRVDSDAASVAAITSELGETELGLTVSRSD